MSTRSSSMLRRFLACTLASLPLCGVSALKTQAQTVAPAVAASFATTLTPPSGLGTIGQTAVTSFGDLVIIDHTNDAVYEYPANGGAVITLVAPGGLGSGYGAGHNPGIVIDSYNALYLEGNYSNCLLRFPYNTTTNTWDGLATLTTATPSSKCAAPYLFAQYSILNASPYYFQPSALAIEPNNSIFVTTQTSGSNNLFVIPLVGSGATATAGTASSNVVNKTTKPAQSAAVDSYGNYYIVESSGGPAGVLEIPAGSTSVTDDSMLQRVDPSLPNVVGVATDRAGNLYVSDSKLGLFFIPTANGVPQTALAALISPIPAVGQATIDPRNNTLYVPTAAATGSGQVIEKITFSTAELGTVATVGPAPAAVPVTFSFNAAATPNFLVREAGASAADFTIASGGTCKNGTAYAVQSSCTVNVVFAPHTAGNISAKLMAVDASGNVLSTIALHGTGSGSSVQVLPGAESSIGSGLKTPSQIAVDAGGNIYVADAGLGTVAAFPKGSGTTTAPGSVGTGLKAPTGVAVSGAGDVFVADSGNVYEIPEGSTGLVASGQITLKSGLGSNLKLAFTGRSTLYIADPDNHRVIKLGSVGGTLGTYAQIETDLTGFSAPSAMAVDAAGNLYVSDGSNLFLVTAGGATSTLLTGLPAETGLAVDASGALYLTTGGQTLRIPNVGGKLTPASPAMIATDNTGATAVALDGAEDIFLTNTAAGNVEAVASSAAFNFGTLTSTTGSATQTFTVLDAGNLPLNVTGFAGTADYSATSTTCTGAPLAIGTTCSVTVTFQPGPGDQGNLTGLVSVTGDEANIPVGINGSGVGAALAASKTTLTVTNANVDSAPAMVTVAAASGTGPAPTGQVMVVLTASNLTTPVTATGTLANGTVTITPPQVPAGTYTFTANYIGDRVYGKSSATAQVTIAAGPVNVIQPTMAQIQQVLPTYPYILAAGSGADEPYDGSVTQYEYNYQVKVVATDGQPLIGVPVLNSAGKQVATNYGSISFSGVPAGSGCVPIPVAADGTATFTTDCLSINTTNSSVPNILTAYTVTPVYSPAGTGASAGSTNPNYTSFTGAPISFTALRNPMVQISSNPSAVNVTAGSSVNVTLTLSSVLGYGIAGSGSLLNNYSLPLQLTCDGLPAYATCTFSYPTPDPTDPQSVDVGPVAGTVLQYRGAAAAACTKAQGCVGPGTVVMTITTNVPPTGASASLRSDGKTAFAAIFGVGLFGLAFGRRKTLGARLLMLLLVFVCGGVTAGITGCSTTQLGASNGTPSPAGTYAVSVTARQVGSQTITQTPGIVYGNQNQMSLPFTMNLTVQ